MAYLNQNKLISYFKSASTLHFDINYFQTGEDWELNSAEKNPYPILFLEQPFNFSVSNNLETNSLSFLIIDQPKLDETDEVDLISKTKKIGIDVIYFLKNELEKNRSLNAGTRILDGWNALSLTEFSDGSLAGWRFELTLVQPLIINTCDLAFSGYSRAR